MGRTLDEDDVLKEIDRWIGYLDEDMITRIKISIKKIPSAQPYTEDEIQKMQDLEQAELDKAFELGKEEGRKEAQPEQRWIPCSVRLPDHPENGDYYLVTIQCEHYDGWDDYVTGFAEWTKHGWDELSCYIGQIKVIAWMPLPEPYGGEQE